MIHLLIRNSSKIIAKQGKPKDFFVEPAVVNREIELPSLLKELRERKWPIKSSDGGDLDGDGYYSGFVSFCIILYWAIRRKLHKFKSFLKNLWLLLLTKTV